MAEMSRRGVIARLGVMAGAGVLAAPTTASAAEAAALPVTTDDPSVERLGPFAATGLQFVGTQVTKAGETAAFRGTLTDATQTTTLGQVVGTGTRLEGPVGDADAVAWVQTQLLTFAQGTISGTGTVTHSGSGTFVINGGTGVYSDLRGSYVTQQNVDVSGGGSATFTFSIQA